MSSNPNQPTKFTQSENQIHHKYSIKPKIQVHFSGQGRTKQSFKDECDINRIMARYQATGLLPQINEIPPQYMDCTMYDFQEHQNFIAGAFSTFHELPSKLRARFNNNPAEFFDFCSQDKNRPEMAEMGLLKAQEAQPIPPPQPKSETPSEPQKQP